VAGAIGRGLAVGLGVELGVAIADGVGDGVGEGDGVGDGVAGPALLVTTAGLDVVALELEQATTASIRNEIEPIRARRPVRTLSLQVICSPLAQ
jgi:hypothetical protein